MTDFSGNIHTQDRKHHLTGARVVDADGRFAHVVSVEKREPDPTVAVQLEDGPKIVLPLSLLSVRDGGEYHVPVSFAALQDNAADTQHVVIPVVEEQLEIGKRLVDTGKGIRVRKTVSEHEQVVDPPLLQDELVVEIVPVGQMIAASELPTTRYDGDTLIVPVFEEVLVVQKQTRLKEEVRITRHKHEVHAPQTVLLKSEQVLVEHFDEGAESFHPGGIPRFPQQIKSESGKSAD